MRLTLAGLVLGALSVLPSFAEELPRWTPSHCLEYGDVAPADGDAAEALWNEAYRDGFGAVQRGEYDVAEHQMCRALIAARDFDARDWRFAETLDELGLIAFQLRDFELAERMQGAAIGEMLLAAGPHGEPLAGLESSDHAVIRPDCASGIRVYTDRMNLIHERVPGRIATQAIREEPWSIFSAGYIPFDAGLASRLDWLISQYLLEENLGAADTLAALQNEILGQ
ncbi:MAG: hypothetical protein GTN89_00635 [Acidobacteria bacterium]|nr:hypothetical protein [Acidobacteriota bacterium]NIM60574.1 hypothetical protein [Acidobacteriota bacterium]NIO57901.1 hypothetical protein [Acidobacteriota bacterium]NIQ28904.1 hypothetical protein [Acidobacteriota bacterium]NIQ83374.1 hypothetical protein [Acidobacteriota bacterium]